METVKLSSLSSDDMVLVELCFGSVKLHTVKEIISDIEYYKTKRIYTTTSYEANIDAENMLYDALEHESDNMYDDWFSAIWGDITEDDTNKLQAIIDEILKRNEKDNISYNTDKEIIIDL